jgi:hypothetical protein
MEIWLLCWINGDGFGRMEIDFKRKRADFTDASDTETVFAFCQTISLF